MHIQLKVMFCVCLVIWCAFRECFASASQVRLVGGATEYEGRLEVFYKGSWGTVCDDYSNDKLSAVVCQSLGLPWNNSETFCCAAYGQGSGPIWLDDIKCEGSETAIEECKHSSWGSHNCGHDEDVSINCFPNNDTAVRLVDGKTEYEGRLEVYKLGRWGTVCGDNVNNKLAAVVCRSLGFPWNTSEAYGFGKSGPIWLDDVQCVGSETGIEECRHKAWGSHTCNNGNAAYIDCLPDNIAVQLVGGATKYEGRLQVYKFRRWITVCGDNGNNELAAVVCRSLGSPWNTSEASRISFYYGSGWNDFRTEVKCQGSEANINECAQGAWGYHACNRWSVVSISCLPNNGTSLRLVGGETEYEGRLEIYRFGRWGTVCGDYVNDNLAAVVCRSLDFPWNTSEAYGGAVYGKGTGSILLDDVKCFGTERRIEECSHNEWGMTNCNHDNDVSINCLPSNDTAVRLVGGETEYEGRLEVYKFGKWGTVCDTNSNDKLAVVVCRSLGFPWNTSEAYGRNVYGKGADFVWLDHVECDGSENGIDDCRHSAWGSNNCYSKYYYVSINCLPSNDVRLLGGATKYEGRLEVYKFGKWINVCSDDLNAKLAAVVCRSLGFPWNTSEAYGGAIYGHISNSVWWNIVNCVGTESRIEECSRRNREYQNCNNGHHLSINCLPSNDTAVRLVGGATKYDGRLEVFKSGRWGSACDPFVNDQLAVVVCRSLGFPWNSSEAYGNGEYGRMSGPVWLDYVKCNGTETSIEECSHSTWGTYKCDYNHIYINCLPPKDIAVRLRGGANKYQGRLEVYKSGKWGTVCGNNLNDKLAAVVCRSLGFPWNTSEAYKGSFYGEGVGPIWLDDVQCLGSETRIDECRHKAWGSNKCNHGMDVLINCLPSEDIPVRLVGGATEFEGRLEVYKSGIWGRVCDNNLNDKLAVVVCRSLGLPWNFTEIYSNNVYGDSSAPTWFDGFNCVGSETRVEECRRNATVPEQCGKRVSINCLPSNYTDVRLVGGGNKHEGRLEVYKFGRWGVLCGNNVNNKVATVVCRSLGLPWNTSEVYNGNVYGQRGSSPVWLDVVNCDGSENGIDECSKSSWGSKNCWNNVLSINCLPSNDTTVRLVGGATEYEGRLEVYKLGGWRTVCDSFLNDKLAAVVCRSLGFPWDTSEAYGGSIYGYNSWLNYVICDGSETKLEDCRHSAWGYHRCNNRHTVSINCLPQKDIAVSLVGGAKKYAGRLEVYKSGKWGTVCDTNLNDKLAAVVCRSLGFPWKTSEAYGGAIYGKGKGRIWLDGVDCVGTEKGIEECRHSTWGSNNCTHDNDVYINCFPAKDSSNQLCKKTSEKIERTRDLSYDDHMQQLLQVETQKMNIAKGNLDIEKKRLAMDEQRLALDQRRFQMQLQRHQIYLAKNRVTRNVADQNV